MAIAQDEQKIIRTLFFAELGEKVGEFKALEGFGYEGVSKDGLLFYNSELDQWGEVKIIFKKEEFDGIHAIELYEAQQKKNKEKAQKKQDKIEAEQRKKEKLKELEAKEEVQEEEVQEEEVQEEEVQEEEVQEEEVQEELSQE